MYHASKWALEGFSQALAQEVAGFGINVTLIEPGGFSTDWGGSSARHADAAAGLRRRPRAGRRAAPQPRRGTPGDPTRPGAAVLRSSTPTSRRCASSSATAPLGIAEADYESRLATWREWQPVAEIAQGNGS